MTEKDQKQARIQAINAAMEATNGSYSEAAKLLNMDVQKVRSTVRFTPVLREKWKRSGTQLRPHPIVTEAQQISRDHPSQGLPPSSLQETKETFVMTEEEEKRAIAEALEKQERDFTNGLHKMGVRGESLEFATAFRQFHGRHFASIIDMAGGGMAKVLVDAMALLNKDMNRLNTLVETRGGGGDDDKKRGEGEGFCDPFNEEKMLRASISSWMDHLGKIYDKLNKAALIKATVRAKSEGFKSQSGMKSAKPGFAPLKAA